MPEESTALATATPAPLLNGAALAKAFDHYLEIQAAIDRARPDAIMTIGDRKFRRKPYWRAVRIAFRLSVEPVEELRDVFGVLPNGAENVVYRVTYRAAGADGLAVTGDGACSSIEKFAKGGMSQATEHNVRSHAHTRAFNRAISNLVGFGEVSAEEIDGDEHDPRPGGSPRRAAPARPAVAAPTGAPVITDGQRKRLFAIAREHGRDHAAIKAILAAHGIDHTDQIPRDKYDLIIAALSAVDEERAAHADAAAEREPGSDDGDAPVDGEVVS
jgi:hypothetical protein